LVAVSATLIVLVACGDDSNDSGNGSASAGGAAPAETTPAPDPTARDEATERAKKKAKVKAKALARAKRRRAQQGAASPPAVDEPANAAPVSPPSDEEVMRQLEKLGYTNRALTPAELLEHCKGTAASARKLSEAERQRLVGICNGAADGGRAEIKEAAVEVCQAAIASELPKEAPLYESALEACEKTGDAPDQARP
jgi:hypothetical protein